MPPKLALLLCYAFCFAVFWSERKQRAQMPAVLWLPTLWMMRCASRNISGWLTGGTGDPSGGIDMYCLIGLIFCGLYTLSRRQRNLREVLRENPLAIILFLYMGVSVFWSDVPFDSFKRWFRTSGDLIMALVLVTDEDPLLALRAVLRRSAFLLIPISLVLSKYFPALGRMQEKDWAPDTWIGVATHKNTLGMLCLLSAFYFVAQIVSAKARMRVRWRRVLSGMKVELIYLAMSIYLLFGIGAKSNSVSSTSKLCFLMATGLLIWFERFRKRPSKVGATLLTTLSAIAALQAFLWIGFDSSIRAVVAQSQNKDPGLAERTDLWRDLIELGEKHPLLGSGYASFWTSSEGDYVRTIYTWQPFQAHNGYVETFLNLGLVGVGLLVAVIIAALRGAVRTCRYNFDLGLWRLALLSACLVENYAEAGFPRPTHVLWFTFLCVGLNIPMKRLARAAAAPQMQQSRPEIFEPHLSPA